MQSTSPPYMQHDFPTPPSAIAFPSTLGTNRLQVATGGESQATSLASRPADQLSPFLDRLTDHFNMRCSAVGEDALSPFERICTDVWFLHLQVCNGGYSQWIENGYDERASKTVAALRTIGAERDAIRLEKALNVGRQAARKRQQCEDDELDSPRNLRVDAWEYRHMTPLDLQYYQQMPRLLLALERYARAKYESSPESFPGFSIGA